jgi:hypothetical protein
MTKLTVIGAVSMPLVLSACVAESDAYNAFAFLVQGHSVQENLPPRDTLEA